MNNMQKLKKLISSIDYNEIKKCLSADRLRPYEDMAKLTPYLDIALYNAIQLQSSLLFLPLQYLEICLRNKINDSLFEFYTKRQKKINLPGSPKEWYLWMPTNAQTIHNIHIAKNETKGTANDIISHLHFGIWKHILNERTNNRDPLFFWNGVVHNIFPNTTYKKEQIIQQISNITIIRNRLFHYEPIWKPQEKILSIENALHEIEQKYLLIYDFISWMSTALKIYMNQYTAAFRLHAKNIKYLHVDLEKEFRRNPKLSFLLRKQN